MLKKMFVILAIACLLVLQFGCGGGEKKSAGASEQGVKEVIIKDFGFNPDTIEINKGETIIWRNKDSMAHNLTGKAFSSGNVPKGGDYKHIFNEAGTFEYTCAYFPDMKGKVVVK